MGGWTSAVDWWEEWQLRLLVLTSLAIQCLLFFFSFMRRHAIPGLVRFMMWLAYLAGDAVAIYALATLFNRHKTGGSSGSTLLEVVWVPVLLLHLGGHDGFTAYNIEDNELWSRHLLTAVSQVTVAVYVFCKSWPPGGDKWLLLAAILLFVPGAIKCFVKPWALKRASIHSLVSSPAASVKQNEAGEMYGLEEYVRKAKDLFVQEQDAQGEAQVRRASVDGEDDKEPGGGMAIGTLFGKFMKDAWVELVHRVEVRLEGASQGSSLFGGLARDLVMSSSRQQPDPVKEMLKGRSEDPVKEMLKGRSEAAKLFVDLSSSSYPRRLRILQDFLKEDRAYGFVRQGFATAFLLLYTKLKTAVNFENAEIGDYEGLSLKYLIRMLIQMSRFLLPWASIGLFHQSNREAYNAIDVKITYAVICSTAVLESWSSFPLALTGENAQDWPEMVAQCSFTGYFTRNKKHSKMMWIVSLLGCNDFLDQHWCMKNSCFSCATISELVLRYLKDGWRKKIEDDASYRRFNDHRSSKGLRLSLNTNRNRPLLFDESVLLWHIATEFCFFSSTFLDHSKKCAFAKVLTWRRRRFSLQEKLELISDVMIQRIRERVQKCSICQTSSTGENDQPTSGCDQELTCCKVVLCRQMSNYMAYLLFVNPEMLLPGSRRNLFTAAYGELKDILRGWEWNPVCWSRCTPCGVRLVEEEAIVVDRLKTVMTEKRASQAIVRDTVIPVTQQNSQEESSMEGENFIDQAWDLAEKLLEMDEKKWEQIQDVWVEMLCFSASRCRGYLHAKALGKGGEFLSYVWLLLFHMGMETFTDKLQREEQDLPSHDEAGSNDTAEPAREVSTTTSMDRMHNPSPGGNQQYDTASTSEIRQVADDDVV